MPKSLPLSKWPQMIGYIEGAILQKYDEKILILVNQIGYEVLLPAIVAESFKDIATGDAVSLFIYYYQTEKQPRPVLIGFNSDTQKDFFQRLMTVEDIGPMKAARALTIPVQDIARAIENNDLSCLQRLTGIGKRTAQKMVASLAGKLERFIVEEASSREPEYRREEISLPVIDVLVGQLGIKSAEARRMVEETLAANPSITTPEMLLEEVLRTKPK